MSNFAPTDSQNSRTHRMQIAAAANAALRGETHNTGHFTVPSGVAEYILQDSRMGAEKVITLSPTDPGAAALRWWVDRSSIGKGTVRIKFTAATAGLCGFDYTITGTKRTGAE